MIPFALKIVLDYRKHVVQQVIQIWKIEHKYLDISAYYLCLQPTFAIRQNEEMDLGIGEKLFLPALF